jgi:hypothetical protein
VCIKWKLTRVESEGSMHTCGVHGEVCPSGNKGDKVHGKIENMG